MQKVTKVENGVTMVAVLYSPEYGSGWYTWNREHPEILYDPRVVEWVLNGKTNTDEIQDYLQTTYDDIYIGGNLDYLEIEWMPVGTMFDINEYDGFESIRYRDEIAWHVA